VSVFDAAVDAYGGGYTRLVGICCNCTGLFTKQPGKQLCSSCHLVGLVVHQEQACALYIQARVEAEASTSSS
jgi:hypothetical protein